jgi:tetratricopeptide (TPR) repeat protein
MSGHSIVARLVRVAIHNVGAHRLPAVLLGMATLVSASVSVCDVIYLKNGRKISAQATRQDAHQVVYEVDGGELSIPLSLVDHIEKSALPAASPSESTSPFQRQLPLPPPPAAEAPADGDSAVIKEGSVDEAYLMHLASEVSRSPSAENLRRLKQAYQQAAVFLTRNGNPEGAIGEYNQALRFVPHDLALTLALGYLQITQNHFLEAVDLLLPETDRYSKSPDIHLLLGSAFYGMENLDQAIAEWNKALAMQDNPYLREALEKAEREREVSSSYQELHSEHFLLRYEGEQAGNLSGPVLNSLEGSFHDLVSALDYSPREVIVVLLYPNQAFRDITRSPSWVGALNDGKIRVPVSGITVMTPEVARVLKHELTHSFVRQITLGHCPTWFNEGLAQLEEGATTATLGGPVARAFADGKAPGFASLEAPFVDLTSDEAGLAYAKSLAGLEYLRDTFGMGEIRKFLKLMPSNPDFNALLQSELRLSYPALDQEVANYIVKRFGS